MNWFDRLYALVQEIEANTRRLDEAETQAREQTVRREIPGQLGAVTVDIAGPVVVDLDSRALRYTNGTALGAAVLKAINQAEVELRERYTNTLARARRDIVI